MYDVAYAGSTKLTLQSDKNRDTAHSRLGVRDLHACMQKFIYSIDPVGE